MLSYKNLLTSSTVRPYLTQFRLGLEKESQRIETDGELAHSDHPAAFGSRSFHLYIQTDFSELQLEAITPTFDTENEALQFLAALHDVIRRTLPENERVWPLSMPPALPENEADIPLAKLSPAEITYREGLAEKYGRRKQMVSGIHYNFEFGPALLEKMWELSDKNQDFSAFKSDAYLKLARGYTRYQWLITYLFGASPRANSGYLPENQHLGPVRSIRNSAYGYRNKSELFARLDSLAEHYQDLEELVNSGKLSQMKEYYSPIRLRCGHHLEELKAKGIHYVELRNFDLNPFESIGINLATCQFVHYFCLFLLYKDEDYNYTDGIKINDAVALEKPQDKTNYYAEGKQFFKEFLAFAQKAQLSDEIVQIIKNYQTLLEQPEHTIAARMEEADFDGLTLANSYQESAWQKPYQLAGFEDMELSTQNLIFDALQKGLDLSILDRSNQFIELSYDGHEELIKNGNMTAHDTMIAYAVMENKTVMKKIFAQNGLTVPIGTEFSSLASALASYSQFSGKAIVIKPKTTNYGLGISIFETRASKEEFNQAVEIAFQYDNDILIENFVPGTEYRFFIVDGKTTAVLKRESANVIGDGTHTIAELIALKNADPMRGENHRTPLESIQIGAVEELMLASHGLKLQDIPAKRVQVKLRENSNVSTGGDSIDMTDEVDDFYKGIAEKAAEVLKVKITGLDLMIPDIHKADGSYTVIEANYNPMMHMHLYPYQGKGRRVTLDVLHYLFPEVVK